MLTLNSARTPNFDAWNTNDWIEHRRQTAYDLKGVQLPVKAKPAASISSYFPGAEALEDDDLSDLRTQQAQQHQREVEIDKQNQWMLAPVFAPEMLLGGIEAAGVLGLRFLAKKAPAAIAEARSIKAVAAPLTDDEKYAIRELARKRYAQANGIAAAEMKAQVHHRIALQFQHLQENADANRLANLIALEKRAHQIATNEWAAFDRSLNGRIPTQAELYSVAKRIDPMIEQYVLRPGVPRPALPDIKPIPPQYRPR